MTDFGGIVCLAVELAFITPLLLLYRRYRWRWLNAWSAAAIAFALGAICALGWEFFEATRQYPGYSEWGSNRVAYFINGVRTDAGWRVWRNQLAPTLAAFGMVGAISALVFRLVAVRTERTRDPGDVC